MTIFNQALQDTLLSLLPCHRITELVEHGVLSDDMIITEISNKFEYDIHSIHAKFEHPQRLLCAASGRIWDWDGTQ